MAIGHLMDMRTELRIVETQSRPSCKQHLKLLCSPMVSKCKRPAIISEGLKQCSPYELLR